MRYRIPEDVVSREVGGEAILLNLETGTYFGLDGIGTEMWRVLAHEGSIEAVTSTLLAGYEVEEPQLRLDIERFIQQLLHKGLLAASRPSELVIARDELIPEGRHPSNVNRQS